MAAAELCRWDDTKWPELCWKLRTSKAAVDVRTELLRKTWPRAPPEWLELEEAQDLLRPHVEPKDLASLLDASTAMPLGVGASKLRTRSLLALIEPCEMHCLEVKLLGLWGLQGLGFCKLQLRLAGHRVFEKSCFLGPCQGQLACLLDSADAFQLAIPMSCGDTLAKLFSDQPGLEIHLFNEFGEGRALVGELSGMEMACLGDGEWQMESSVFLESKDHAGVQILSSSVVLDGPSLRLVVSHSHAPAALDAVPFWLETSASASSAPTAEVAVPSSEEPQDLILTLRQLELLQSAREEALRRGADLGLIDQTGGARFKVYCISMAGETLCTAEAGWGGILDATVRAYEMLLELRLVLCNGDEVSLCHRSFCCGDLDALLEGAPLGASLALGAWAKLSLEMSRPMRAVGPVGSVESETALMGSPISGGEAADAEAQSEGVASLKSEERCAEAELGAQAGPHDLNAIDSESSCHSMASPHTARLTGASEGLGQPSVMLEITNALHLPLVLQKCPNTFVSYTWLPESEDLGDTEAAHEPPRPTRRHELPDEPEPAAEESLGSEPPTWREAPPKEAPTLPRPVVTSLRGAGAPPPRSETSRDGTSSASRAAVEGAVRAVEVRQEKSSPGPLDGRGPLPQELVHERSRMEVRPLPDTHPARGDRDLRSITSAGPVTRRQSPSAETQSPEPAEVPMAFARRSPTLFAASTSTPSPPRRRGEQQSPALAPRSAESTVQRAESTWTLQNAALEKTSPRSQASERPRWATSPLSWSIERTRLASTGSTHVPTPEPPARHERRSERLTGWSERLDVKTQRLARILRGAPKSESESE
ncbi:UPF0762 protein [Durusdinium trenchii]|uniref:UPF0762 protein n=1 Tax=Durusdinium trenchii TaxID=1381693 RepID=A0ABP0SCT0_9DINO